MPSRWSKTLILAAGLGLMALAGLAQAQPDLVAMGQAQFQEHCADCHRTSGEGLPPTFPALKGDPFVLGDAWPVIDTVLKGRKGQLASMPSWQGAMTPEEIAAVITYIRQAWGNQAPPVNTEQVTTRLK
jgi:cytochrome c oxidase subunit 2